VDIDLEVLAAIGRVVVEATSLEWTLAGLIATRQGWDEQQQEVAMAATNGTVRRHLTTLASADPSWDAILRLNHQACALLDERNRLVHSVVVSVLDEDYEHRDFGLWHARSGSRPLPSVGELIRLASDLNKCVVAAVMSHPEAEERFERLGAADGLRPPRALRDGPTTA
jgi:hypothetical protein